MEWYVILLIILASLLLLFIILGFIIGYFVCNMFIHPYCRPENEVIETEVKWNRFTLDEFNSYNEGINTREVSAMHGNSTQIKAMIEDYNKRDVKVILCLDNGLQIDFIKNI